MRKMFMTLAVAALIALGSAISFSTTAKADGVSAVQSGDYMPLALTAEAMTAISVPSAYASLAAVAITMVGGCEIRYRLTGRTCNTEPLPAPSTGYNQGRGLAPMPDGTFVKAY
jgi:hypothetical protein